MRTQARGRRPGTSSVECVVFTPSYSEFSFLKNICGCVGIRMHHASTVEQTDFLLIATEASVVVFDAALPDCTWRCAVRLIADHHPLVAMLVIADTVERPLLQDAFSLGVCGVIWKPIQLDTVSNLIRTAHQAWEDRRWLWEELAMTTRVGN
jgi:DNA-binding NarL/FixJ family response regulator